MVPYIYVDYTNLNRITKKNRYFLSCIDKLIDRFKEIYYFTKLDLILDYHQQRVFEPYTHKTVFRYRYSHFKFNIIPFGLTNTSVSFSNMILKVLGPILDKWIVVYLDNILIYSKTKIEYLQHIRSILSLLCKYSLYMKLLKYSFMQEKTEFLEYIVSKHGIHTNTGFVRTIREQPYSQKQKNVQ